MERIKQQYFSGERALFGAKDLEIVDSVFDDGESPLKEAENITAEGCLFRWKYPFWYCRHIHIKNSTLFEMARAGIWYTDDVTIEDTMIEAPKELRRCDGVVLKNVSIPDAKETLWNCRHADLDHVIAKGSYFGMGTEDLKLDHFELYGDYCFDGAKNVEVHNSKFLSKDCFWNSENVTIYDSFISGEYFAWNSKNVTLVNCTIESLQGMCYATNLVMKNCKVINTTLAFEYSTVDAELTTKIDSVLNPAGGTIKAKDIGTLIMEKDRIDPSKTRIELEGGKKPVVTDIRDVEIVSGEGFETRLDRKRS